MSSENKSKLNSIIGKYSVEHTIGSGTFGKVKLGIHLPTQEKVSIRFKWGCYQNPWKIEINTMWGLGKSASRNEVLKGFEPRKHY